MAPAHRCPIHASFAAILLGLIAARGVAAAAPATRPVALPDNLPLVRVDVQETITSQKKSPCTVRLLVPADDPAKAPLWKGTIHIRGATSQAYPKKSYALALDAPQRLLDLRSSAHWVLNAAYIDRSLMRHKLSYDLFRSLSAPGRPRYAVASRFVEVQLNGDYIGVYLLMEHVDGAMLGLEPFNAADAVHSVLYKAKNHDADFAHTGHSGFEQEEPDPAVLPDWGPLDDLNRLTSSSPQAAFDDPQRGIAGQLDLDNAIDFHLLVLATGNADGITKNYYLARPRPQGDRAVWFFFVPWDYDGTFGRNWDSSHLPVRMWLSNHLFARLSGDRDYRRRFVERWRQLRQKQFTVQTINRMIDDNARTLGPAVARNAARWPTNGPYYRDNDDFAADIGQMKDWIASRMEWLDREFDRLDGSRRR